MVYAGGGDPSAWCEALAAALPGAELHPWPWSGPVDYAAVWAPTEAVVAAIRGARAVFLLGAGVDHLAPAMPRLRGVRVVRIEDAGMADQMVEYALLATLQHHRRWHVYADQQRARCWERHPARPRASLVVGVMGLGVLGGAVAAALRDFGFTVRGWTRRPRAFDGVATFAGDAELPAFLAGCAVLIDVLPLTPATAGLLRRETLSLLPRGASLVNLARGGHVVDDELRALLDEGHLAHATLDVFAGEPLAPESPWWGHPRVTVTPHVAALSLPERCAAQIAAKLARLERGEDVSGVVDLDAGY